MHCMEIAQPGWGEKVAEPTDKINLNNPTEVARETLRRLAMRRIAPTPDNYQTLFEEIVGKPTATTDSNDALRRNRAGRVWSWT